jgi:hypothetical protein
MSDIGSWTQRLHWAPHDAQPPITNTNTNTQGILAGLAVPAWTPSNEKIELEEEKKQEEGEASRLILLLLLLLLLLLSLYVAAWGR